MTNRCHVGYGLFQQFLRCSPIPIGTCAKGTIGRRIGRFELRLASAWRWHTFCPSDGGCSPEWASCGCCHAGPSVSPLPLPPTRGDMIEPVRHFDAQRSCDASTLEHCKVKIRPPNVMQMFHNEPTQDNRVATFRFIHLSWKWRYNQSHEATGKRDNVGRSIEPNRNAMDGGPACSR